MDIATQPRLSPVRSIDDLLGLVPHLLGFHPTESLVLLVLSRNRLELTSRLDLASAQDPLVLMSLVDRICGRFPAAGIWALAYAADGLSAWECLSGVESLVGAATLGAVHIDGEYWWPAPGERGGLYRPRETLASLEATVAGLTVRPDRGALDRLVSTDPDVGGQHDQLWLTAHEATSVLTKKGAVRALVQALSDALAEDPISDELCARLAALVQLPAARDEAILRTDTAGAAALTQVWCHVSRRVPPDASGAALALAGLAAWVTGDGALQNVCLERGLRVDPDVPLLSLLDDINQAMVPPTAWPQLRAAVEAGAVRARRRPGCPRRK